MAKQCKCCTSLGLGIAELFFTVSLYRFKSILCQIFYQNCRSQGPIGLTINQIIPTYAN